MKLNRLKGSTIRKHYMIMKVTHVGPIVNELTSRKTNNYCIKEIKHNGRSIYKSQELSEAFNNHFSTIGPKLANAINSN